MLVIGSIAFFGGGTGHYLPGLQYRLHPTEPRHLLGRLVRALIVVVATYILLRSRLGLVLSSVRDNEVARAVPVRR